MIEADYRLREYEARVRMQKRIARDRAMWRQFEEQYGKDEEDGQTPPPTPPAKR
jgi:hypothetical protein